MALTIEDGTGVTGADSFITEAEYDAAQVDYFGTALTGDTATKEAAIRRGWLYLKSLDWKSTAEYPTFGGTVPEDVKAAQAILARAEQQSPGGLQPSVIPAQQKVLNRVGEIGWKVIGATGTDAQRNVVTMATDLLTPYVNGFGKTKFLSRA